MQFSEFDLGHLNLIRATYICQSLAPMGHQLSKLNDIPEMGTLPILEPNRNSKMLV